MIDSTEHILRAYLDLHFPEQEEQQLFTIDESES